MMQQRILNLFIRNKSFRDFISTIKFSDAGEKKIKNYKSIDVIGGGIIGITLATELLRELKRHNIETDVHLFERRGQLGMENTEKSIEGVRAYWSTPEEIRMI